MDCGRIGIIRVQSDPENSGHWVPPRLIPGVRSPEEKAASRTFTWEEYKAWLPPEQARQIAIVALGDPLHLNGTYRWRRPPQGGEVFGGQLAVFARLPCKTLILAGNPGNIGTTLKATALADLLEIGVRILDAIKPEYRYGVVSMTGLPVQGPSTMIAEFKKILIYFKSDRLPDEYLLLQTDLLPSAAEYVFTAPTRIPSIGAQSSPTFDWSTLRRQLNFRDALTLIWHVGVRGPWNEIRIYRSTSLPAKRAYYRFQKPDGLRAIVDVFEKTVNVLAPPASVGPNGNCTPQLRMLNLSAGATVRDVN